MLHVRKQEDSVGCKASFLASRHGGWGKRRMRQKNSCAGVSQLVQQLYAAGQPPLDSPSTMEREIPGSV